MPDVGALASAVAAAGADGLSLVNTIRGLALDDRLQPVLGTATGGYSGPALKPIALAAVHAAFKATALPIVGMGGVSTGLDALELIAAGASAVALGRCSSQTRMRLGGSRRAHRGLTAGILVLGRSSRSRSPRVGEHDRLAEKMPCPGPRKQC